MISTVKLISYKEQYLFFLQIQKQRINSAQFVKNLSQNEKSILKK